MSDAARADERRLSVSRLDVGREHIQKRVVLLREARLSRCVEVWSVFFLKKDLFLVWGQVWFFCLVFCLV